MKKILLFGISGVGKSAVINALADRGFKAIDADTPEWCEWVETDSSAGEFDSTVETDRDWVWREDRIRGLLATEDTGVLFVSGCPSNVVKFFPQFDHIVLLSAPVNVIVERLATRTGNLYGKQPHEVARVVSLKEEIEPRLRKVAGYEIDTTVPLAHVVETLLRLTGCTFSPQ